MNPDTLQLDNAVVYDSLQRFIREELRTRGFTEANIAVSGGLDSALVLRLVVDSIGTGHVHPVFLPCRTSSGDSRRDARVMFESCGLPWDEFNISPMADAYLATQPGIDNVRTGNLMARLRMAVVFDRSKRDSGLVIGTGNKSELLVGYSTWYGDMACSMVPLGDLYKTQVRSLAAHVGIPAQILAKPPSADLWPGQTDEGEIGVSYEVLDQILYLLVDEQRSATDVAAQGFDADVIRRVERKMRSSQFKRELPPVAKLSRRAV
jgi:NAD+ synthase